LFAFFVGDAAILRVRAKMKNNEIVTNKKRGKN
jgi:hypothetical protein